MQLKVPFSNTVVCWYENLGAHYLDVTLSTQVVDLCRLHLVDDLHQTHAVSQVTIMQLHV